MCSSDLAGDYDESVSAASEEVITQTWCSPVGKAAQVQAIRDLLNEGRDLAPLQQVLGPTYSPPRKAPIVKAPSPAVSPSSSRFTTVTYCDSDGNSLDGLDQPLPSRSRRGPGPASCRRVPRALLLATSTRPVAWPPLVTTQLQPAPASSWSKLGVAAVAGVAAIAVGFAARWFLS